MATALCVLFIALAVPLILRKVPTAVLPVGVLLLVSAFYHRTL